MIDVLSFISTDQNNQDKWKKISNQGSKQRKDQARQDAKKSNTM